MKIGDYQQRDINFRGTCLIGLCLNRRHSSYSFSVLPLRKALPTEKENIFAVLL